MDTEILSMVQWFIELTTNWDSKTWTVFGSLCIGIISITLSRFQKYFEKERYKMFIEAEVLKGKELEMHLADEAKFNAWFDELSAKDKTRIRKSLGFLKICETLKKKHLGERYFEHLDILNNSLQNFIGDKFIPIKSQQGFWQNLNKTLFGINPFSIWSFRFCLILAIIYPLVLVFLSWLFGGTFLLGNVFVEETKNITFRLLTAGVLALIGFFGVAGIKTKRASVWLVCVWLNLGLIFLLQQQTGNSFVIGLAYIFNAVVAVIGSLSILGFRLAAIIFALIIVSDITSIFIDIGALYEIGKQSLLDHSNTPVLGITIATVMAINFYLFGIIVGVAITALMIGSTVSVFAIAIVLTVCFSMNSCNTDNKQAKKKIALFYLAIPLYAVIYLGFILNKETPTDNYTYELTTTIFLAILPFTNAIVDWLSLCYTRGLLYKLQHSRHSWFRGVAFVLIDLLLVLFFIAMVTATTLGLLGGVNSLSGTVLIDFNQVMIDVTMAEKVSDKKQH